MFSTRQQLTGGYRPESSLGGRAAAGSFSPSSQSSGGRASSSTGEQSGSAGRIGSRGVVFDQTPGPASLAGPAVGRGSSRGRERSEVAVFTRPSVEFDKKGKIKKLLFMQCVDDIFMRRN